MDDTRGRREQGWGHGSLTNDVEDIHDIRVIFVLDLTLPAAGLLAPPHHICDGAEESRALPPLPLVWSLLRRRQAKVGRLDISGLRLGMRPQPRPRLGLGLGLLRLGDGGHLVGSMRGQLAGIRHEPSSVRFGVGAPAACLLILGWLSLL